MYTQYWLDIIRYYVHTVHSAGSKAIYILCQGHSH